MDDGAAAVLTPEERAGWDSNSDDDGGASGTSEEEGGDPSHGQGLSATLQGDALAKSLVDAVTANEMHLVRSEVKRLRGRIAKLESEKDDMVDNFRMTTQILLNRIKDLEGELEDSKSRPQTAVVIDRLEGRAAAAGKPPLPRSGSRGSQKSSGSHEPEVLRIEEDAPLDAPPLPPTDLGGDTSMCGNCGEEVPETQLVSHGYRCYRERYRCKGCNEVLAICDKEAHLAKWSDPVRCLEAAAKGDVETIQTMVEHGVDLADLSHPDTEDTVLHIAGRKGAAELIAFFMGYGVDIEPLNGKGETPLHLAVESGNFPTVRLLIELGADLNAPNAQGEPPLMLAARKGVAQIAKHLVEMRADAEARTRLGDSPLQVAQRLGHLETVLALGAAGAPLRRSATGGTPKHSRSNSPMPGVGSRQSSPPAFSPGPGAAPAAGSAGYPPLPRATPPQASPLRVRGAAW
eukprot:TRINITY_DN113051_c0_g1_i1.p1 TRINITY_DN113051_c0_g1~~TRINITY_DN113051_c0_g1_i1.p1  ORF type:complete len:460 (+),score=105.41 TRINITY_DN113051_c0_g1_i1:131-1510(+)